jgi:hypothetical protein
LITGAHSIIYSTDPEADREFLRDILKFPHVDVGGGWLIFGLPPAEVAVHPAENNNIHELFLMCDDITTFRNEMSGHNITCSETEEFAWGRLIRIRLPGGGSLGVYQPKNERPASAS